MYRYLEGLEGNLVTPPVRLTVEFISLKRQSGPEIFVSSFQNRTWYHHTMLMERFILYNDYEVLRSDRSDKCLNYRNYRGDLNSLLIIGNYILPPLPAVLYDHPMPRTFPYLSICC